MPVTHVHVRTAPLAPSALRSRTLLPLGIAAAVTCAGIAAATPLQVAPLQTAHSATATQQHCPALVDTRPINGNPHPVNLAIPTLGGAALSRVLPTSAAGLTRTSIFSSDEGSLGTASSTAVAQYTNAAGEQLRVQVMDLIHVCDAQAGTGEALLQSARDLPANVRRTDVTVQGHPAAMFDASGRRSLRIEVADRCEVWLEEVRAASPSPALTNYAAVVSMSQLNALCSSRTAASGNPANGAAPSCPPPGSFGCMPAPGVDGGAVPMRAECSDPAFRRRCPDAIVD